MQALGLFKLFLLCILETRSVCGETFEFPTQSDTVAQYSTISATSTCSTSGTYNCNSTCPNRNTFPTFQAPLKSERTNCTRLDPSDHPSSNAANTANGTVKFNVSTNDCVIEKTVTPSSQNYFAVTVWIKVNCSNACEILSIDRGGMQLEYKNSKLYLGTVGVSISQRTWLLVVIRFNGVLSWFVSNTKKTDVPFTGSTPHTLKLGPTNNLTGFDTISMVDARLYSDSLTDREATSLYTGTFTDINFKSDCRCPVTHPTLVQDTLPVQYMKCKNGVNKVLRLGTNVHIPEYMTDKDNSTSWISERETNIIVTLTLKNQFQIKSISVHGIKKAPTSLQVILFIGTSENNVINFKSFCDGSAGHCEVLNDKLSGESFSYNFESSSVTKRSDYQLLIADKIVVQAMFSQRNYFTVSELKLEARCNCFGQDRDCSILNGSYTCHCSSSSRTESKHCDKCDNEFYRLTDDFKCGNPCNCNTTGSVDNTCKQVGGQCSCHKNIVDRQCNRCKHNTAKFDSSGCTACPCNPEGITSCSDSLTCNCKQNVENTTGNCATCLPNYYNITRSSGCTFCDCDSSGTMDVKPNCNNNTGKCKCKANVQGQKCNDCKDTYFGLSADKEAGCDDCLCNIVGSESLTCNKATGQCPCVDGKDHNDDGNRQCIPHDLKLEPSFGPVAGGTLLTLTGTLLGKEAQVALTLDGIEQAEDSRNLTSIIFKTKPFTEGEKPLSLTWTNLGKTYRDERFERETGSFTYKKNPQLLAPTKSIRSFSSGGCTIQLSGSSLDSVAYPKMRVYLKNGLEAESVCSSEPERLYCQTPMIDQVGTNLTLSYGFVLDGVKGFENVSTTFGTMLIVVADPVVYVGNSETFRNTFDKVFRVKGERMKDACNESNSDVTITLDDKNCALESRSNNLITCDPGETFPGTARTVQVKVKIGNKEFDWGELKINSFWTNTEFIGIAAGAGVFLIAIIVIVICIVRCRNKNQDDPGDSIPLEITPSHTTKGVENEYTRINPVAFIQPQQTLVKTRTPKEIADAFCKRLRSNVGKVVKSSLIERCNIEPGKICTNKGKKIRVISGQYNASTSSPYSGSSLTIKTLLESYPEEGDLPDWLNNNLLECTRLQDFDNNNVLRMKGIAVDAKNIYIIYPAMSNKTLKDYLISKKEHLTTEQRLEICTQVAEGMNYLSTQGIVHKDLAARNCWVSRDFEVKISDASFSFDLYPDEYLESIGRYQPIRWMAPESLRQGFYDTKSDVWSYGVLVWEVFTNGHMPYFDIRRNDEVKQKVRDEGCRLGKPNDCSDAIFHVIEECHKNSSEDRPNFFIVQNMLDNIINPTSPIVSYANQQDLEAGEDGMEDYENIRINPPPRPPKGRRP